MILSFWNRTLILNQSAPPMQDDCRCKMDSLIYKIPRPVRARHPHKASQRDVVHHCTSVISIGFDGCLVTTVSGEIFNFGLSKL